MSTPHPVQMTLVRPERMRRLQLLVRLVVFLALGLAGVSFGVVLSFGYLFLPGYAAIRIGSLGAPRYLSEEGRRITGVLRWLAAIEAWAWLALERLPTERAEETVSLRVTAGGDPTAGSALWRVLTGLPSLVVLWLLAVVGALVGLWAALSILVSERVGELTHRYLAGLVRWTVRLLAYQASLVDAYAFRFRDEATRDDDAPVRDAARASEPT